MSSFGKIWNDPTESSDTIESLNVFCNKLQKKREIYIYIIKSQNKRKFTTDFLHITQIIQSKERNLRIKIF